jgi:hypothetical protein
MPSAGFETAIQAIERQQTDALDRAANGIGEGGHVLEVTNSDAEHTGFRNIVHFNFK